MVGYRRWPSSPHLVLRRASSLQHASLLGTVLRHSLTKLLTSFALFLPNSFKWCFHSPLVVQ